MLREFGQSAASWEDKLHKIGGNQDSKAKAPAKKSGPAKRSGLDGVHAKLKMGSVNDPAEAEADRMADRVMAGGGAGPALAGGGDGVRRACAGCEDEEIKRKADGGGVGGGAEAAVGRARGMSGQKLGGPLLGKMQSGFGASFGNVRVHSGGAAAAASKSIGARAFTAGSDVFFGAGEFSPGTAGGQRLLAHELAHVVQGQPVIRRESDGGAGEGRDADGEAERVLGWGPFKTTRFRRLLRNQSKLRRGSSDRAAVEAIQKALLVLDPDLDLGGFGVGGLDGAFGSLTKSAVEDFQIRSGLKDDGVVGFRTIAALDAQLESVWDEERELAGFEVMGEKDPRRLAPPEAGATDIVAVNAHGEAALSPVVAQLGATNVSATLERLRRTQYRLRLSSTASAESADPQVEVIGVGFFGTDTLERESVRTPILVEESDETDPEEMDTDPKQSCPKTEFAKSELRKANRLKVLLRDWRKMVKGRVDPTGKKKVRGFDESKFVEVRARRARRVCLLTCEDEHKWFKKTDLGSKVLAQLQDFEARGTKHSTAFCSSVPPTSKEDEEKPPTPGPGPGPVDPEDEDPVAPPVSAPATFGGRDIFNPDEIQWTDFEATAERPKLNDESVGAITSTRFSLPPGASRVACALSGEAWAPIRNKASADFLSELASQLEKTCKDSLAKALESNHSGINFDQEYTPD